MKSAEIINTIIEKKGYNSYLEIGVRKFNTFDNIRCERKIGVDPNVAPRGNVYKQTSDEFFSQNKRVFDIIFIDGLHHSGQVIRDVYNALNVLSEHGTIILDDVNPPNKDSQEVPYNGQYYWCGDVWRAWVKLRACEYINQVCIQENFGYGIITHDKQVPKSWSSPSYTMLKRNQKSMLNLVTWEEYKKTL